MASDPSFRRMIVAITGATGTIYGVRVLEALRTMKIESHLVVSKAGDQARAVETDYSAADLRALADKVYAPGDVAAAISSGSFRTMGMIVAPCSVRTLSDIAHGVTSTLLARAADVCLKERRRLVLLFRETPLHAGHLKSMLAVTEMGGIVAPPVPAFYTNRERSTISSTIPSRGHSTCSASIRRPSRDGARRPKRRPRSERANDVASICSPSHGGGHCRFVDRPRRQPLRELKPASAP